MKEKILKLRKKGKSYSEISKTLNCSKATINYHCAEGAKEKFLAYRRKNRKIQLFELKNLYGGKCSRCSYDKCFDALHFHHKDPSKKEALVSKLFASKGKAAAYKEAEKCELICANCHAELHAD